LNYKLQVLKGEGAVIKNREVMGATNPAEAKPGTVRKDFAVDIEANSIHGSDSLDSAKKEINFFDSFPQFGIIFVLYTL
jgi:nucleoside-diphosphate kinase